jgi:hypothetical protein
VAAWELSRFRERLIFSLQSPALLKPVPASSSITTRNGQPFLPSVPIFCDTICCCVLASCDLNVASTYSSTDDADNCHPSIQLTSLHAFMPYFDRQHATKAA